ncbi:glucuronate isomerase [Eudoraea sp.]|uniref:glucuronate isomerase n=1 Tax=Eudoraea sp. TaxID=1979955 RepID=UPI003C75B306
MVQKDFIHDDFLLQSEFAKKLYHNYAKDLPIIDYHNHLSPQKIADNYQFQNISEVWLHGDHYKWRAMRTMGISEEFITGSASDKAKFQKWGQTVPFTMRNPLYHWTHLELKRYFGINELLDQNNATEIYNNCSEQLSKSSHSTRGLLKQMKVEVVCTTDDPIDSLIFHDKNKANEDVKLLPAFRPDKAYAANNSDTYNQYLDALEEVTNIQIRSFADLKNALENRITYFHEHGCRLADHGLDYLPYYKEEDMNIDQIFNNVRKGEHLNNLENDQLKSTLLVFLSKQYHKKGWVQQFHLGALRNNNTRMLDLLGPDTGFDSIGDFPQATSLSNFLNHLDSSNELGKTIIYNLNPADNEVMAAMIGNFNDGSIKGKVQFGSGWWFLDQKDGMEKQLNSLSNIGLLSCFVGMLTDSRSFLSFPRHEYFRRVLCNLFGNDVAKGELPADEKWLGKIVSDVCYNNAKAYFPF